MDGLDSSRRWPDFVEFSNFPVSTFEYQSAGSLFRVPRSRFPAEMAGKRVLVKGSRLIGERIKWTPTNPSAANSAKDTHMNSALLRGRRRLSN
jgi:hypothetical protein